jgi:hypothetical protein
MRYEDQAVGYQRLIDELHNRAQIQVDVRVRARDGRGHV